MKHGFARLDSDDLSDEQMLDLELEDRHALGGREPPFGARRAFLLVAVNIGFNFNSFLQLVVIVPSRLAELAGDEHKGQAVGSVLLCAGLVSIFAAPPIGSLSDRMPWSPRLGRRAPCWTADKWSRPDGARRWSLVASFASALLSSRGVFARLL